MSSDDSAAPQDLQANIQDLRKTIFERQAQTVAGLSSSMSSSLSIGAPGSALGSSTSTVRGSSSMTTAPTKSTVFIHTTPRKASIAQLTIQSKSLPAYLVYVTENGAEQRFVLTKPVCTIGRREDRDIVCMLER